MTTRPEVGSERALFEANEENEMQELELPAFLCRKQWTPEQTKANDRAWKACLARRFKVEDKARALEHDRRKRATLEMKIAGMKRRTILSGSFQERILKSLQRQLAEMGATDGR